jgi:hypothetical protein
MLKRRAPSTSPNHQLPPPLFIIHTGEEILLHDNGNRRHGSLLEKVLMLQARAYGARQRRNMGKCRCATTILIPCNSYQVALITMENINASMVKVHLSHVVLPVFLDLSWYQARLANRYMCTCGQGGWLPF